MASTSKEAILKWLSKQGYPLEMKVAKSFQDAGFSIKMAQYYKDETGDKYREIDVVATTGTFVDFDKKIFFNIHFVIECKFSLSKPWLLFKSTADRETLKEYEGNYRISNYPGNVFMLALSVNEKESQYSLFKTPSHLSYGVTRAHSEISDMPYNAALSCSKAAHSLAKTIDELMNKNKVESVDIFFPVIVTEGQLFDCALNDDGEADVNEVDEGCLLLRNPAAGMFQNIVNITTFNNIDAFSSAAHKASQQLCSIAENSESVPGFRKFLTLEQ